MIVDTLLAKKGADVKAVRTRAGGLRCIMR